MKYKVQFPKGVLYISLPFPQDHLSQGQHPSFCPNPAPHFRDQSMDVVQHPGLSAQGVEFHLLCHHPEELLSARGAT